MRGHNLVARLFEAAQALLTGFPAVQIYPFLRPCSCALRLLVCAAAVGGRCESVLREAEIIRVWGTPALCAAAACAYWRRVCQR